MTKNLLRVVLLSFCLVGTALFAQPDHLIITEFAVSPTAGEFIEIHNPTEATIDLSDYYLTDATFAPDNHFYYNIVTGVADSASGGAFGDWHARFPDGASILPGEYQTISLAGSASFMGEYGVEPTYELFEDDAAADAIPDMREALPGTINDQGGLSNSGEVIVLYWWDGESDLVKDVDYVVWGDQNEAVDKTGVIIDGIDADDESSGYVAETDIADQTVVNADNDDDEDPHDDGMTAQRRLDVEDVEDWGPGGNGITGHDETSENTSWKGGIWSINEPATPGRRALSPKSAADSLTIADIQFVRADSIGSDPLNAQDDSPFDGLTITVTGLMLNDAREVFLANRWGGFVQDPRGGPWSGLFIIQHDTLSPGVEGTLITSAQPGDLIRITGTLEEFPPATGSPSFTELALITDPVTPIEFPATGVPIPDPILLTPGDMGFSTSGGGTARPELSERWESVLARFENLRVLTNDGTTSSNVMIAGNDEGNLVIGDFFQSVANIVQNNGGVWPNPENLDEDLAAGTVINVTGYIRGASSGAVVSVDPSTLAGIEIASTPPVIENFTRSPAAPTSSEGVDVSGTVRSTTSTIATAQVLYRVDGGAFQTVDMTAGASDDFSGTIPPQADGSFVEYIVKATDAAGVANILPADTSAASGEKFFYHVRDAGLTIVDLQRTPFAIGNSGYVGLEVTVSGIVTSDSTDFAFYYIQDGNAPWSGIQVNDTESEVGIGDEVTVTGEIRERFGVTQINNVSSATIFSKNNTLPDPVVLTTGELASGSPTAEQWESVLVQVQNVTVTDPRPDGFAGFGEFVVDDGSGGVRVDDLSINSGGEFAGQVPSNIVTTGEETFPEGSTIESLTGIHFFSFGNFKLAPRNDDDVVGLVVSVEDEDIIPVTFDLNQNYPNPFNPETTIRYQLAQQGEVRISIFNILGQRVRTLVDQVQPAGVFTVRWDGTNDVGARVASGVYVYRMQTAEFVKSQKMLLLK